LKQLGNNSITEMTKSGELAEDTNHVTKSVNFAYCYIPKN